MTHEREALLLGYLLGALEDHERESLEKRLADDPDLSQELNRLAEAIAPLEHLEEEVAPPEDLAARTCQWIEFQAVAPTAASPLLRATAGEIDASPRGFRWTVADMIVTLGICFVAAMLFFPAISNSRYTAQLTACQNNLRQIGLALTNYSQQHDGFFPQAGPGNRDVAGIYAPTLVHHGFLPRETLLICPASELAENPSEFRVPTFEQIDLASGRQLHLLQQAMGGSYGYNLGVVVYKKYLPPRNRHRAYFAIMADAPDMNLPGRQSANHGGRGQNVLFEDGHVRQLVILRQADFGGDNPFLSNRGYVEPGNEFDDAVVGESNTKPLILQPVSW